MKKIILSIAAVALVAVAANAQNGNIEAKAKKAAKDAGCTGSYTGQLTTSTNFLGGCALDLATTGAWNEVYVSAPSSPEVRVAPFARVEFCGTEILSVECLLNF
jgi:hypothetical protein